MIKNFDILVDMLFEKCVELSIDLKGLTMRLRI